MEVTLLGTGSPAPSLARGGSSVAIEFDNEPILIDCGPRTVDRLLENGFELADIETLLFTHHHVDHNADFINFVFSSWTVGREALTVYGPEGMAAYVEAIHDLYEEDIAYREWFGHGAEGVREIEVVQTTPEFSETQDTWRVTALPVEHSIETYAFRFEERSTGATCVISSDTRKIPELVEFARGADVLIQDAGIAPVASEPDEEVLFDRIAQPMPDASREKHKQNHCDVADASEIAAEAEVDTLVMTHLLPYRDHEAMREEAAAHFSGEIHVGWDGLQLSV